MFSTDLSEVSRGTYLQYPLLSFCSLVVLWIKSSFCLADKVCYFSLSYFSSLSRRIAEKPSFFFLSRTRQTPLRMYVPRVAKRTADGTLRPIFFFFLGFFCFTDFYYIREYEVGRRVSRILYSPMVIGCCSGKRRFLPIIKTVIKR